MIYGRYRDHGYQARTLESKGAAQCLPEDVTAAQAFEMAGLSFNVAQTTPQILTPNGISTAPEFAAVYREDTGKILGIQSNKYAPVQNSDIARIFDQLDGIAVIESALCCREGRRLYVTARIGADEEITSGDRLRRYLHVFNSHDGGTSVGAFFTDRRLACANQIAGNIRAASSRGNAQALTFKHTSGVTEFVRNLPAFIDCQRHQFRSDVDSYRQLTHLTVTPEIVQRALAETYSAELARPIKDKHTKENRARTVKELRAFRSITSLFQGFARGADLPGFHGTAWGLLNAITEHETHGGNLSNTDKARQRLEALYHGTAGGRIEKARHSLLAMV